LNKAKRSARIRNHAIKALDNIYAAFKGHRLLDRFGFNSPKREREEKLPQRWAQDAQTWTYYPQVGDWLNPEHEATLTGFISPIQLLSFIEEAINTELE
jgi:hypothetical protein